jgi:hypothetical protein
VTNALFDHLVELSGLSPIFAAATIGRSLERAGLSPDQLRREEINRLIPELSRTLAVFLGQRAEARIQDIRKLGLVDFRDDRERTTASTLT